MHSGFANKNAYCNLNEYVQMMHETDKYTPGHLHSGRQWNQKDNKTIAHYYHFTFENRSMVILALK